MEFMIIEGKLDKKIILNISQFAKTHTIRIIGILLAHRKNEWGYLKEISRTDNKFPLISNPISFTPYGLVKSKSGAAAFEPMQITSIKKFELKFELYDDDNEPINISGAKILFQIKKRNSEYDFS